MKRFTMTFTCPDPETPNGTWRDAEKLVALAESMGWRRGSMSVEEADEHGQPLCREVQPDQVARLVLARLGDLLRD